MEGHLPGIVAGLIGSAPGDPAVRHTQRCLSLSVSYSAGSPASTLHPIRQLTRESNPYKKNKYTEYVETGKQRMKEMCRASQIPSTVLKTE